MRAPFAIPTALAAAALVLTLTLSLSLPGLAPGAGLAHAAPRPDPRAPEEKAQEQIATPGAKRDEAGGTLLGRLELAYAAAAEEAAPSIVTIHVTRPARAAAAPAPRRPGAEGEADAPYLQRPEGGVSGVAVGIDQVLTSAYNVDGATAIAVETPLGRRLEARVLGVDEQLDLALLGVSIGAAPDMALRPLAIEGRAAPKVGSFLVVVGRGPRGELGVNPGIVSALSRFRGEALQTDASLNYGNFGGAALDIEGRFVGLPVRLSTRPGVNSGVGFVIPAKRILELLPSLARGEARKAPPRAFLGVQFGREVEEPAGVEIARVVAGAAAEAAGIEAGDVIRRMNDMETPDAGAITDAIQARRPGEVVRVEAVRAGKRVSFEVTLGERPPP